MRYNRAAPPERTNTLRDQDQQFFDSFMLVVGILIGVAVGLFFLVRIVAIDTQGQFVLEDPAVRAQIEERIRPIGRVVLLGDAELEAMATATAAPTPVETVMSGPQVYNAACYLCHSAPGVGGAPVLGDAAAWAARLEQGVETLNNHAINGFQGTTGFMPAKGGRVDLSDEAIVAAVEYMIEQVAQ
jgi:cytochrome c5